MLERTIFGIWPCYVFFPFSADQNPRFYCNQCGKFCGFNFVESVEQDVNIHMQQDNPPLDQVSLQLSSKVITPPQQDSTGVV